MEPGLRGPERDVQLGGNVGQRQSNEVVEDDDRPPFRFEPAERLVEELALGEIRSGVANERRGNRIEGHLVHTAASPPRDVEAGMNGQSVEPGIESVEVAQPRQVPPGSNQRLLDRVSRKLTVPEDEAGGSVQSRKGRAGDRGEGVMIAPSRSFDETPLVHGRLSCRRGQSARARMLWRRLVPNRSRAKKNGG